MDLSTRNRLHLKAKALLCFQITADTMGTGRKAKCMDMGSSPGAMGLPTKVSINMAGNMAKGPSSSPPKNTTKANGSTASSKAEVHSTTNKAI